MAKEDTVACTIGSGRSIRLAGGLGNLATPARFALSTAPTTDYLLTKKWTDSLANFTRGFSPSGFDKPVGYGPALGS
jgi:hypothetical protein